MSTLEINQSMKVKTKFYKRRSFYTKLAIYAVLIFLAFLMLYPLSLIVNNSLKTDEEFFKNMVGLVESPTFSNYKAVWREMEVIKRTLITVMLTAAALAINVGVSLMAAFPIARRLFRGSEKMMAFVLVSMFFPGSLVATIVILKDIMHIYGSALALIIMWGVASLQLHIFMLVNFIKSLPKELDEAAYIDGCGYFRYIFTIAMPLMLPIVATISMLKIIGCWNDFMGPYIYCTNPDMRTLSTGLFTYLGQYSNRWNMYSTAVFIVAAPMIIIYVFGQRFIIEGMVSGALKG